MDNYKIKVKDEAESKEAQELLFTLGYRWGTQSENKAIYLDKSFLYTNEEFIEFGVSKSIFSEAPEKELTVPELRVLVAAKQPQDPALISGAEALRALADGQLVQWMTGDEFQDVTGQWEIREFSHPSYRFRIKPQTIKLELEIPAPYKAKIGGRDDTSFVLNVGRHQYCYKTEDEYTKARDALEAVFDAAVRGTNS